MPCQIRSRRAGFSIAEFLVAVTLFAVGLLALSTTVLAVQRWGMIADRRWEAALLATSRFERLRGEECAGRAGGTLITNGIAETWTVSAAPGLTLIADSLAIPSGAAAPPAAVTLGSALPC